MKFTFAVKKLLSIVITGTLLFNSVAPSMVVFAQSEPTPTDTPAPVEQTVTVPTDSPLVSPEPTAEAATPSDTVTPTPYSTFESPIPTETPFETVSPTPYTIYNSPTPIDTPTPNQTLDSGNVTTTVAENVDLSQINLLNSNVDPATVTTDQTDYSPTSITIITGNSFTPNATYTLEITSTDDPAVDFLTDVTTDSNGNFVYNYQLDGNYRPDYTVYVKDGKNVVAKTTFTDTNPTAVVGFSTDSPCAVTINVTSYTNNGGQSGKSANGSTPTFSVVTEPGTTVTFSYQSSIVCSGVTYNFSSASPSSPATSGAAGSNINVSGHYIAAIVKTDPTLSILNSPVTYNGNPQSATVNGSVAGTVSNVRYGGSTTSPTNSATYAVTANFVPTDTTLYNSLTNASAGSFVIQPASQTINFAALPGKTFGDADFSVSATATSGLTVTFSSSTTTVCTVSGTTVHILSAGTCTIEANQSGNTNYNAATPEDRSFNIAKVTPTLLINNSPTVYTGSTLAASVIGSVPGSASNVKYNSSSTVPTDVNTYAITADFTPTDTVNYNSLTGASAGNFIIGQATSTTAVNCPAAAIYTGNPITPCTVSVTGANLSLTPSATYSNNKDVGTATASYAYLGDKNHSGSSDTKHFDITQATSSVDIVCPTSVTFNNSAQTPCTASFSTSDGLGGSLSVNYSNNTNVGTAHADAAYSGDSNHRGSNNSTTFAIIKADTTTTVVFESGPYVYKGSAYTATASITGPGLNQNIPVSITGDCTNVTGTNGCTASANYAESANYFGSSDSKSITISPATASITVTPYSVNYDGNEHKATGSATGVLGADLTSFLDLNGTKHTNANTYSDSWSFDAGSNYKTDGADITDVINKVDPICNISGYSGIYDGDSHGAAGTCKGVKSETLSGLDLGSSYTSFPGGSADWTYTDTTGNYNNDSGSVTINIQKANALITVTPYHFIYDTNSHSATGTATGVKSEALAGLDLSGTTHTDAGEYTSDPWTFTDVTGNYNKTSSTVHDIIDKADASVHVDGYTGIYDGNSHGATGTATGVGGVNLIGGLNFGSTFTNVPGGTANWTFSGGTNYNDQNGTANIVISQKPASVTPNYFYKVYGEPDPIFTGVLDGFLTKDNVSATYSRTPGETVTGSPYTISATLSPTSVLGNYDIKYNTNELDIGLKTLTVTPDNQTKQYSDPGDPLTFQYSGFISGEGPSNLTTQPTCSTTRTTNSPAGTYDITCSGGVADNYSFNYVKGTFTVIQENTAITYIGNEFVTTAGPTITTAPVQLSTHLTQEADGDLGNISLAKVTFTLTPTSGSPTIITNIPVSSSGVASSLATIPVGNYTIQIVISSGNLYWKQDPEGIDALTVAYGTLSQNVTGGGWVSDAQSMNGKDNFGFNVTYNKNSAPKGNFLYMFRGADGYDYQLKSNSWANGGLSFNNINGALFTAKATLSKIDRVSGVVLTSDGSYTFSVNITDGDLLTPKVADTYGITIYDSSHNIWKQLPVQNLGGGNVIVHSK